MKSKTVFLSAILLNILALVGNVWVNGLWHGGNAFLVLNLGILLFLLQSYTKFFHAVSSASNSSGAIGNERALISGLKHTQTYLQEVKHVISEIKEIGNPRFADVINQVKDEAIRSSFHEASEKIISLREKEQENNWVTQGVAAVADLKQKGNDLAGYTNEVIATVVKYLNANQGGFFILKEENENQYLELVAAYAYSKKKFLEKRVNVGDGLLGQVVYEKDIIYLTDVPKNYVHITSGLGEGLPRCICIVPLMSEGKVLGAFEIASFETLSLAQRQYLKKISETIGYNLGAIEVQTTTARLLRESQQMSQEVKSQEEELRQNMEELTATQEQMNRKQSEMDAVLASLSTVELDLNGRVLTANEIFLGITGYRTEDIVGKVYKSLIPQQGNDPVQYDMMWSSILSGRSFSGEFRIVNKAQKEMWIVGNFTPIMNQGGKPYKVMVISLFTTQDKEKLFELQEMVAAMKSCFPMAEINADMTFRTANELFLSILGIKRVELKKLQPANVLANGSLSKLEDFFKSNADQPGHVTLELRHKDGSKAIFNSTLLKIGSDKGQGKKNLVILRDPILN
jgi:PAS domain S-box-containing protein